MYRTLQTLSWMSFYTHMLSFSQPTSLDSESSRVLTLELPLPTHALFWPFSKQLLLAPACPILCVFEG